MQRSYMKNNKKMELINGKQEFTENEKKFNELNLKIIRERKSVVYSNKPFSIEEFKLKENAEKKSNKENPE